MKGMALYMVSFGRDLIAEKNKRESMKSSVIKYWNVHYSDPKEEERLTKEVQSQEVQAVLDRLKNEAEEDEAKKRAEIDRAYLEAELNELAKSADETYNAFTGSYSGKYGKGKVDSVTQEQVAMILDEKNATLRHIIDAGQTK